MVRYSPHVTYLTQTDLEKVARRIWWGSFPKLSGVKSSDAPRVGVNLRNAVLPEGIRSYQWEKIGDFEIFVEAQVRGGFRGRFHVRRAGPRGSEE